MTDYTKLVAALQYCEFGWSAQTCDNCEYSKTDCQLLLSDAAAAIKGLQAEVERLKDSNDELREAQTYIDHYGDKWMTSAKDVPTAAYEHGYADGRDEAEQALEPKRGEWVKNEERYGWHCSCCKVDNSYAYSWNSETMKNEIQDNFCPNCGAKMEVQDDKA